MSFNKPIEFKDIRFGYDSGFCLSIPNLQIYSGEKVFLQGDSGSGKSTLLGMIAGIHLPQDGQVHILERDLKTMSPGERDQFRGSKMGYIFQMFNLLPYLTVLENVVLPCHFSAEKKVKACESYGSLEQAAEHLLGKLQIGGDLLHRQASDLSMGQGQRVAAARALIGSPEIIIADEPTSALDKTNKKIFLDTLLDQCDENQSALIYVSHDLNESRRFSRVLELEAGRLEVLTR